MKKQAYEGEGEVIFNCSTNEYSFTCVHISITYLGHYSSVRISLVNMVNIRVDLPTGPSPLYDYYD